MSYVYWSNRYSAAAGNVAVASSYVNSELGLLAQMEDRMEASQGNGVISGFACTVNGMSVDIASGEAYCEGRRFSGSASVDLTGLAANTYYIYIDPTDTTTPYKAKTTAPTVTELTLSTVVTNGSALSSLTDRREWGSIEIAFHFHGHNTVTAGFLQHQIAPVDFWIEDVKASVATAPTGSPIIVDVHVGDQGGTLTTIFTTTSYRPTLTTGLGAFASVTNTGYPEYGRLVTAGQVIAVYVDQTDSNSVAQNLEVLVRGRRTGKSS